MLNMSDLKAAMNQSNEVHYPVPDLMEDRYRLRLCLSEDLRYETIYQAMEPDKLRQEAEHLGIIKDSIDSEEAYEEWRENYLKSEYERLQNVSFVVCEYGYKGLGEYSVVLPKAAEQSFLSWIEGNMSAVFRSIRKAEETDIFRFIALNATKQDEI